MATRDMGGSLVKEYGMEPWAAHLLIGYLARFDVVTVAGSMAVCTPKNRLPKPAETRAVTPVATEESRDARGTIAP